MVEIVPVIHKYSTDYSVFLWIKKHTKWNQILMTLRMALFLVFRKSEYSLMKILMQR